MMISLALHASVVLAAVLITYLLANAVTGVRRLWRHLRGGR